MKDGNNRWVKHLFSAQLQVLEKHSCFFFLQALNYLNSLSQKSKSLQQTYNCEVTKNGRIKRASALSRWTLCFLLALIFTTVSGLSCQMASELQVYRMTEVHSVMGTGYGQEEMVCDSSISIYIYTAWPPGGQLLCLFGTFQRSEVRTLAV